MYWVISPFTILFTDMCTILPSDYTVCFYTCPADVMLCVLSPCQVSEEADISDTELEVSVTMMLITMLITMMMMMLR